MKITRAILIGTVIWILGVSFYSLSFFVNIIEDAQLQANLVLLTTVMPLVWLGSKVYHKKDRTTHGYTVGLIFFLVAAALDAMITLPLLVVPNGGSYYEFFTEPGFWLIGLEFVAMATLYWYVRIYVRTQTIG